jgi:hypothetical protein
MDTGYVEPSELNLLLTSAETVTFRMVLLRDGDNWRLHTLLLEVFPKAENEKAKAFDWNYGAVQFLGGSISGETATRWLHQRAGEVRLHDKPGASRRFTLPAFTGKVSWRRFPSHALWDFTRMPWPLTRYDATGGVAETAPPVDGFLLADGLPFFPDLKTAILKLVYHTDDPREFQNSTVSPSVIVRIGESAAWLHQITLSPTSVNVTVAGTRVTGSQLTISGSTDIQFQEQLATRKTVECLLPNGVPSPLWIVLSRGDQWQDYYHRDARWPLTREAHANVVIQPGDISAEIAARIAQGEDLTTEFKATVPQDHEQMLKTVAAFANAKGGLLQRGVKDSGGELVGYAGKLDDLTQMIRTTVFPEPATHLQEVSIEQRRIVAIFVDKGSSPPYGLRETHTRYFVRRGATTFPARPEDVRALVLASQSTTGGPFASYVL